jgi:arylsulfatase A-like enzyme
MILRIRILVLLSLLAGTISGVLYFQFLRNEPARRSSFLFSRTSSLTIREDFRQGVILTAASPLIADKIVPPEARLIFAFGIPKQEWDPAAEPFRFTLSLQGRKQQVLFHRELAPSSKKEDRRWQEVSLDLSKHSKQLIHLQFRLDSKLPGHTAYLSQAKLTAGGFENAKQNVLLVTIDTLRRDHVSAYGYAHDTTPSLDSLAKKSTFFTSAYSNAPLTVPSITSLMTSTYFSQHQVANNASAFDGSLPTLAEVLHKNGYSTAAYVGNAVLRPNRGLNAGFDVYNAYLPDVELNRRLPERTARQLTDAALSWLRIYGKERFFLWIHYQDPHAPYTPPPPYNAMFLPTWQSAIHLPIVPDVAGDRGIPEYAFLPGHFDPPYYVSQYDGEIRFADNNIQTLLTEVQRLGISSNTIIIVLSDHGEALGEQDHYFAHGFNVTPELIEVPLIVSVPRRMYEKRIYPVQNIDVAPTLLQLLNFPVPASFHGQSLYRTDPGRKAIAEQPNVRWAVYCKHSTYVYERTGEEQFHGSDESTFPELRKTIQDLIANNLYGGVVFAFSGGISPDAKILSDKPFRRAFLFGGEKEDRIIIDNDSITLNLQSSSNDVDYVFLEPQPDSVISTQGFSLRDSLNKTILSSFRLSEIAKASVLPAPNNFSAPGCIVIRKPGKTNQLELTDEQKEELRSIGYVDK